VIGLPQIPRSTFADAVHPQKSDVVGRAASAKTSADRISPRCAQAFFNLARTAAVRADRRLRTDDEAIRAQSTILG
jgi:hypothetical protein